MVPIKEKRLAPLVITMLREANKFPKNVSLAINGIFGFGVGFWLISTWYLPDPARCMTDMTELPGHSAFLLLTILADRV